MKIFKKIICLMLIVISIICLGSCSEAKQEEAAVRTGDVDLVDSGYFETVENTNTDTEYRTVAKKKISGEALLGYETVSLGIEDYLITYDVVTNIEDGTITLNVYFDDTEEVIIENFIGIPMKNYNDEEDVLFNIDGERIFLSEINTLNSQEQCTLFHSILNAGMLALSLIEPSIKILVYTHQNVIMQVYYRVKDAIYLINYSINKNNTQPTGFVNGQANYTNWKLGSFSLDWNGCEAIAGYNLVHALKKDFTLADTIFLYESLGIEIGSAQGYFGSNPYQISYFLDSTGVKYNKVLSYKTFEKLMKDNNNYYIILSRWNSNAADSALHTFMIDKNLKNSDKYIAYNYNCYSTSAKSTNDYKDFFKTSISDGYICAYFIKK